MASKNLIFLREVALPLLEEIASEISIQHESKGYRAIVGTIKPLSHPKRPIVDSISLTIYKDETMMRTIVVFCISDNDAIFVKDINVAMGGNNIPIDDATRDILEDAIRNEIKLTFN
jgi:hypothetical protein